MKIEHILAGDRSLFETGLLLGGGVELLLYEHIPHQSISTSFTTSPENMK